MGQVSCCLESEALYQETRKVSIIVVFLHSGQISVKQDVFYYLLSIIPNIVMAQYEDSGFLG